MTLRYLKTLSTKGAPEGSAEGRLLRLKGVRTLLYERGNKPKEGSPSELPPFHLPSSSPLRFCLNCQSKRPDSSDLIILPGQGVLFSSH
jgi:hypothetical protein